MFTNADVILIQSVIAEGGNIWENEKIKPVKDKIKTYFRNIDNCCCYCRRVFEGEFRFDIDIEHILPKSKIEFKHHMFTPYNLNISCKRCNMEKKGKKTSFVTSINDVINQPFVSKHYKFIHPNLDIYCQNIKHLVHIEDNNKFIKYIVLTDDKGQYTYDFFELEELEINQVNEAQGVHQINISNDFSDEIISEISELLKL